MHLIRFHRSLDLIGSHGMFDSIDVHQSEIDIWHRRCGTSRWRRRDVAVCCDGKRDNLRSPYRGLHELFDRRWTGNRRAHVFQCQGDGKPRPTRITREVFWAGCEQRGGDEHQCRFESDYDCGNNNSCHSIVLRASRHILKRSNRLTFVRDGRINDLLHDRWLCALNILSSLFRSDHNCKFDGGSGDRSGPGLCEQRISSGELCDLNTKGSFYALLCDQPEGDPAASELANQA